jgi:hypothetical protein
VDAAEDASDKAEVSTVAFAAGGALLAVGVGLLIFGGAGEEERGAPRGPAAALLVGRDVVGASVAGRW